ncbi:hypothetical protein [Streptosporangium roseum]|uniref:hypothetical protein n=1 Tax=Streptosporangium roseum TaxID=2001 RepID=UPI0011D22C63|nr:hypothetical protein [Streptosporangium roseum]
MPRKLWWRLVTLLETRGRLVHPCALRMARHLTHHADEAGRLVDIPAVLGSYSARHALGRRTGWTDFMRLVEAGLLRQVCAAAPERQARYVLALDLATLPDDLPVELAAELRRYIDDPRTAARGNPTMADVDAALAECEVIREGCATRGPAIRSSLGCGRLHTSPYTREGTSPSHRPRLSQQPRRPRQLPFEGQDFSEEKADALNFVRELSPEWARQRGGQMLSETEMVQLSHLVALLLRHMPRSEAKELLTAQVASATDLAKLITWRAGRTLNGLRRSHRRATAIQVDDDGSAHAAWLAANAERNTAAAERRTALVEEARRRARQIGGRREADADARLDERSRPTRPSSPEGLNGATGTGPAPSTVPRAAQGPLRAATESWEVFERDVLHRHAVPVSPEPPRLSEPEPEHTAEADAAALAAERAWLVQMMAARSSDAQQSR